MIDNYLDEVKKICDLLDRNEIQAVLNHLRCLKGRLFVLGIGGSAANASHCVNDFRKICGIEAYAPTDNVAELTARTNDDGWETTFSEWLKVSKLNRHDVILVLSVGGGNSETSQNIVQALEYAKDSGVRILGIVSRNGGRTKKLADACIFIPVVNPDHVTPHAEAFQGVLLHCIIWSLRE